jgi:hypothetical protein
VRVGTVDNDTGRAARRQTTVSEEAKYTLICTFNVLVGKYLEGLTLLINVRCSLLWTVRRHDVRTVTANTAELLSAN